MMVEVFAWTLLHKVLGFSILFFCFLIAVTWLIIYMRNKKMEKEYQEMIEEFERNNKL